MVSTALELRSRYEDEAHNVYRYDSASFWDRRYHLRRQAAIASFLETLLSDARSFLDVGCGSGEYLAFAREQRVPFVCGTDLSVGYCSRAGEFGKSETVQSSADGLPFATSSIDVVLCSEVLEHLPSDQCSRAVGELCRVARKAVLITTPNGTAAIRRLVYRLSPGVVARLDESVGHINIMSSRDCKDLVASVAGWSLALFETAHVLPPVVGERMKLPIRLSRVVEWVERTMNRGLSMSGNCMFAALVSSGHDDALTA